MDVIANKEYLFGNVYIISMWDLFKYLTLNIKVNTSVIMLKRGTHLREPSFSHNKFATLTVSQMEDLVYNEIMLMFHTNRRS